MSTNEPPPDNHRVGAVRNRSQVESQTTGEKHWTKRDTEPGHFMDQKADDEKLKGVRQEKATDR
jgi:hypothetical protein